ncbi:GrlR family regulatory protein [Pseudomonas sp. LFM046]|uniref:GrlR family regulatory protein n=1 Tax=Pseudomonas sp. LFM046 TaxID=1608357 RepID=UPI0005CFD6AA|nr:GrlR family regulatory protein [Pseudomonas sp. LFM046]
MSQGIFHVRFQSNLADFGEGLVVVKDGSVNGGDGHFLYRGTLSAESGPVSGQLSVDKWRTGNHSVVNLDHFKLNVQGAIDYVQGTLSLQGQVENAPHLSISISGQKVADAV